MHREEADKLQVKDRNFIFTGGLRFEDLFHIFSLIWIYLTHKSYKMVDN